MLVAENENGNLISGTNIGYVSLGCLHRWRDVRGLTLEFHDQIYSYTSIIN